MRWCPGVGYQRFSPREVSLVVRLCLARVTSASCALGCALVTCAGDQRSLTSATLPENCRWSCACGVRWWPAQLVRLGCALVACAGGLRGWPAQPHQRQWRDLKSFFSKTTSFLLGVLYKYHLLPSLFLWAQNQNLEWETQTLEREAPKNSPLLNQTTSHVHLASS